MVTGSSAARRSTSRSAIVLSALLVLAVAGWFTVDLVRDRLRGSGCDSTDSKTVISVTAAPDIAPVVTALAGRISAPDRPGCYSVAVTERQSEATAEALAVSDGTNRPDIWIPESTAWLQRAQDKGAWNTPVTGVSVASSPVVMALTEKAAGDLGWPGRQPTWADLLGPGTPTPRLGFPDPARDPVGLATLLGISDLVAGAADPGGAATEAMRRLSAGTVYQQSELFDRPAAYSAFPTSERAVLHHNAEHRDAALVAVYPAAGVPGLDYPFVVLPQAGEASRKAAESFLATLLDHDSAGAFADAGLRAPDGGTLRDPVTGHTSAERIAPVALPGPDGVEQALNAWAAVNLSGRLQVLIDVSGSMNERVPGTNQTRMALTVQAAAQGLRLLKPSTTVGMWLFSTKLDGDRDYRMLLPVQTVSEQLAGGALDTLAGVRAKPNGSTGLYDTVLAAYQDSRRNWAPGRINTVVVLTDGENEDPDGISLETLLAQLKQLQDPKRPLTVIGIGIGPGVDRAELQAIAAATGGQAFTTPDPAKIGQVFYAALSRMLCQPPTCKPPA